MARPFALKDFAYAHRGLWTKDGLPENSLGSFSAAADAGLGIELDLRPSADGEVMVFHDPLLQRMTGAEGQFENFPASTLKTHRLNGGDEPVPSFDDLLSFWPQDLPVLAEMKIDGSTDPMAFAQTVGARLMDWPGLAAAMSFSDIAVRALPDGLMRGQLIGPSNQFGDAYFDSFARRAMADGIDYLAVHYTDAARAAAATADRGMPVVVWTVRTEADLAALKPYGAAIIFEHFSPALALDAIAP
ncbi:glycerophosphoryl diester phosphodiesterase family protein [Hyphomonas neptunium ATCC 15444]|uniref:Glycerophosphoryl diester phosphodiesterase family protein n=2 Tax=Hyphomonas TaxID=85 RepID=Q0BZW0_HYPNA|nr:MULTISPECIES: glycerophosphodiester phosphodiesterase family protein [Hyphomonas]ABI75486.1 glycerophosphoryl diester phosphodiesterase family protein [Hyphomonas neptunium ATCC 15444]KCZ87867.1 glycerophosphoryl diester phosphodiesterase family protein [Hyphomonas hirschiana VP5]